LQTTIATILQEPVGFQVLHSLVLEGLIEYLQQNACCQQGPNRKEKIKKKLTIPISYLHGVCKVLSLASILVLLDSVQNM
jgi:hypothetical protein